MIRNLDHLESVWLRWDTFCSQVFQGFTLLALDIQQTPPSLMHPHVPVVFCLRVICFSVEVLRFVSYFNSLFSFNATTTFPSFCTLVRRTLLQGLSGPLIFPMLSLPFVWPPLKLHSPYAFEGLQDLDSSVGLFEFLYAPVVCHGQVFVNFLPPIQKIWIGFRFRWGRFAHFPPTPESQPTIWQRSHSPHRFYERPILPARAAGQYVSRSDKDSNIKPSTRDFF